MLEQQRASRHSLSVCRTNIVFGEYLKHCCASHPCDQSDEREAKGECRQDEMLGPLPDVLANGDVSLYWHPFQTDGEDIEQEIADHEPRQGKASNRYRHRKPIDNAAGPPSSEDTQKQSRRHGKEQRRDREGDCRLDALSNELRYRCIRENGDA